MGKTKSIAVKKVSYVPTPGARLTEKQAERYGRELDRLSKTGPLTVERVLQAAERPTNPIHAYFEWDDTTAAVEYRKYQARYLMRSVSIVVETRNGPEVSRAFHCLTNVAGEDRAQWFDSATVFTDEQMRTKVIQEALSELYTWKNRYQQYSELAGIIKEIEIVEHSLTRRGTVSARSVRAQAG